MLNREIAHQGTDAQARARILRCSIKVNIKNKMRSHNLIAVQKNAKSLLLLHLFVNIICIMRIRAISRLIFMPRCRIYPPLILRRRVQKLMTSSRTLRKNFPHNGALT